MLKDSSFVYPIALGLLPECLFIRKRDEAHKKVKEIFYKAIQARRDSGRTEDDMLQTLIDSTYKWAENWNFNVNLSLFLSLWNLC